MKYTPNPYARRPEDAREPPRGLGPTLKFLGPGLILAGSVVGSGEIILTTTLGATVVDLLNLDEQKAGGSAAF